MLPRDIDTADALRHLSTRPDDSPQGLSRRRFLQAITMGAGGVLAGPALFGSGFAGMIPGFEDHMAEAAPLGPNEGVLVVVTLAGGNDWLNTVVPHGQSQYYTRRGSLAYPANVCWGLGPTNPGIGLTPNLVKLKQRYDKGDVAVLQGIGLWDDPPTFSHFDSMARWMNGLPPGTLTSTGWLGRYLDGLPANPFAAVSIDESIPQHLIGNSRKAMALSTGGAPFGGTPDATWDLMYKGISDFGLAPTGLSAWGDTVAASAREMIQTAALADPLYDWILPEGPLVKKLTLASRLINANLGTRVISVTLGNFDSHKGQPGMHPVRMQELDAGIEAFFAHVLPQFAGRVSMLVFSEFSRTPTRNDSNGFDHGWAGDAFLIGDHVAGGVKGTVLNIQTLESNNHIKPTMNNREVYSSILSGWLGGDPTSILGGAVTPVPGLFASGPS